MNTDVKACMRIHVEGFGKLKVASCLYTGTFAAKPQTTGLTLRPRHSIYYQHGKGYSVFYLYEASVLFSALKSSRLMLIRQHSDTDNERITSTHSTEAFNPYTTSFVFGVYTFNGADFFLLMWHKQHESTIKNRGWAIKDL